MHPTQCADAQLQLELTASRSSLTERERERFGTFQDSVGAPVHRWFKYPAGFSYKLVETLIRSKGLRPGAFVLDPFTGSGTTNIVAKQQGINSIGIEAHPFVMWVAGVKCFWEYDMDSLYRNTIELTYRLQENRGSAAKDTSSFPALIHKCYSAGNLQKLVSIRQAILDIGCSEEERDFFLLALTSTLRAASKAGTGWPYIAPTKYHEKQERDAIEVFCQQVGMMYRDIQAVRKAGPLPGAECRLLLMDARAEYPIEPHSIDLAVTSPPYLNNYDYADRTRLEMYFLGWAKSWREITTRVRDRLITAATTQIRRSSFPRDPLGPELHSLAPAVHQELSERIDQLRGIRLRKGGKKSYDVMVGAYFNDMLEVLKQVCRVLKPGSEFVLVVGDSAPYGIHVPTEQYLGRLGQCVGFSGYRTARLRERGGKWANNPQRHNVKLSENMLALTK